MDVQAQIKLETQCPVPIRNIADALYEILVDLEKMAQIDRDHGLELPIDEKGTCCNCKFELTIKESEITQADRRKLNGKKGPQEQKRLTAARRPHATTQHATINGANHTCCGLDCHGWERRIIEPEKPEKHINCKRCLLMLGRRRGMG